MTVTSLKENSLHELEFDRWINQIEPERFRDSLWPEPQGKIRFLLDRFTRPLRASGRVFLCTDGNDRLGVMAVEPLKWDSDFFRVKCGRIAACGIKQGLKEETRYDLHVELLKEALKWAKENQICLLQRRVLSSRKEEIACLKDAHFEEADHMVTMFAELKKPEKKSSESDGRLDFRTAQRGDEHVLLAMTRGAFPYSRFVMDKKLKAKDGDKVYEHWIDNLLWKRNSDKTPVGEPATVLVCLIGEKIVGYAAYRTDWSFELPLGHIGQLELIVVDPDYRRQGIGRALFNRVIDEMWNYQVGEIKNRVRYLEATTWTAQQDAVALYENAGLEEKERLSTYHLWLS